MAVSIAAWRTGLASGIVTTVLLLNMEQVTNDDFLPARPDERRFPLHMLVNF